VGPYKDKGIYRRKVSFPVCRGVSENKEAVLKVNHLPLNTSVRGRWLKQTFDTSSSVKLNIL